MPRYVKNVTKPPPVISCNTCGGCDLYFFAYGNHLADMHSCSLRKGKKDMQPCENYSSAVIDDEFIRKVAGSVFRAVLGGEDA